MRGKDNQRRPPPSSPMVDDRATEKLKRRLQDWGLIVNAGAGKLTKPSAKKKGGKK
jgi:hypothetical protein